MTKLPFMQNWKFLFFIIVLQLYISCNRDFKDKPIQVSSYSSYNASVLDQQLTIIKGHKRYDSLIVHSLQLVGLPNTDIEIAKTYRYGAFSVIEQPSQRRFFLYSPSFFDSVRTKTGTDLAILSICFHELAHQFYRHPLKPGNASRIYEKQADRYSGYQMCLTHATLEQALLAMQSFGNDLATYSHPDKNSRLLEIAQGYCEAKLNVFKDSSYLRVYRNLKSFELTKIKENMFFEKNNIKSLTDTIGGFENETKSYDSRQNYLLYGEQIYITSDNEIKLYSNNELIGKAVQSSSGFPVELNLDGVKFYLEGDKRIYSKNPDNTKLEVGMKY
jgi:hypothetical protein